MEGHLVELTEERIKSWLGTAGGRVWKMRTLTFDSQRWRRDSRGILGLFVIRRCISMASLLMTLVKKDVCRSVLFVEPWRATVFPFCFFRFVGVACLDKPVIQRLGRTRSRVNACAQLCTQFNLLKHLLCLMCYPQHLPMRQCCLGRMHRLCLVYPHSFLHFGCLFHLSLLCFTFFAFSHCLNDETKHSVLGSAVNFSCSCNCRSA